MTDMSGKATLMGHMAALEHGMRNSQEMLACRRNEGEKMSGDMGRIHRQEGIVGGIGRRNERETWHEILARCLSPKAKFGSKPLVPFM
jgi:hypothetical protein